nr:hypothetical protein [Tanacetum cinerariifolium]
MSLLYYMEGYKLHFGRPEFSLITGFRFGTDEEIFCKLSDDDAICLCLLLALEVIFMGRLLTFNVDDTLYSLVENIEAWNSFLWGEHLWCHLYDEINNLKERHGNEHYYGLFNDRNYVPTYTLFGFVFAFLIWILETFKRCESWWIKDLKVIPRALGCSKKSLFTRSDYPFLFAKESRAPPIKEHHGLFETYLSKLEKARKRGKTCFMVSLIGGTTDSVRKKWLNDLLIMELNFRLFNLETIIQVLSHERSDRQAKLKFTDEFSSMTSDLCDSLNSMFADLIKPADPDEDIGQNYLREEELRLCLEGEEKMRCEHQKLIIKEYKIRLDESKRLRLEEENMLQLEQQKKNKRKEFMNSNHCKNLLSKLAHAKRIQLCSSSKKIQPKQILELQILVGSTVVAECVRLLQKFQQDDLESSRGMMRLICETRIKVQLPVVLERANIFQKNGINPSKYTITFRLVDNVPKYKKQNATCIKDVEDLQVRIENLEEIFSYLRNRKLKPKEVILRTDDETSSKDDASSNDEISSSEDLINYLSARDVEWQLPENTQEEPTKPHYGPIKTEVKEPLRLDIVYPHSHVASSVMGTNRTCKAHYGLRSLGPVKEEMVHVKKPYNMVKVTNVVLGLKHGVSICILTSEVLIKERMFEGNETGSNDEIQVSTVGLTYYWHKLTTANDAKPITMLTLTFAETYNLVAFLEKPAESEGFKQTVDFLNANPIKYALTVNPMIYTLCIEQFWDSAKVKTVKGDVRLQALVDGKKIIVNEASIRRDLRLDDAEGTACLPNYIIFKELTRMGAKTTAWNEFSSTMASAIICLAKNQKFNFSNGEDRLQLNELINLCTNLQKQVLDLEKANTAQVGKIASLKKRVKKLERRNKSRTSRLKRLRKVGTSRRIESSEDEDLGDQEDVSKQGRIIVDINVEEGVTLVDETQERNDQDKFDTCVLDDDEVVAEKEVSTADPVTTAGEVVATADVEIKAAKPNAVTTVATTTPKAKGIVMKEPKEITIKTATTTTVLSQSSKDKAKEKTVEFEKPLKKKHQIMIDEEVARNLEAQLQAELEEEERLARQKQEEANIALIRIEEENASAELKRCLEIVPDDEDDVTIEATPLSSKSLTIIDYKIYKEERKSFFQIIRAYGNSQMYLTISKMLKNFNREDLEVLWSIVKSRFKKTKPVDNMDNLLFQTLKTIFEHHIEDTNQETHFGTITKEQRDPTSNYHLLMKQIKRMSFFRVVRSDLDEFPAGDEMFMEIDEVVFKIIPKDILNMILLDSVGLRCSSSTPFSTRVKTKISKRKKTSVIHDKDDDRKKSLVTGGRKGKEKVIEDEGICRKGNKADVSIYKRAMVNGKAKIVEDVGAVKRGKERGVNIKDGGFSNDGGKETVVTRRAIGSKKMEGKSVKVESE